MIESFTCRDTEALFNGKAVARFANIAAVAMRKLAILNRAGRVDDLRVPPGNRLEALKGARAGQYSICINGQWRICFRYRNGGAFELEIVDYH
jgi:proteic killer suppression protein